MKANSTPITRVLWQAPALILFSIILAIVSNFLRTDGLSLAGSNVVQQQLALSDEDLVIPLLRAKLLFEKKSALFIDARSQADYEDGHITGSLNIPFDDFDPAYIKNVDLLDQSKYIITYCDGEHCDLSLDLALMLKDLGHLGVHYLINGWTEWKNAELPTEVGGDR